MPAALLRHCAGGCGELVPRGRCPECERQYDQRRGTANERGYNGRWRAFRRWFINQLIALDIGPFCGARLPGAPETNHSRCAAEGLVTAGTDVDHIRPHKRSARLLFDELNLQLLCKRCHALKTATEDGGFGK